MSTDFQYDELVVNDEETKYKKLAESQERHIERLERRIVSLEEELSGRSSVKEYIAPSDSNTTIPQGIQLSSAFRADIESKLRQKAIQKLEAANEVAK